MLSSQTCSSMSSGTHCRTRRCRKFCLEWFGLMEQILRRRRYMGPEYAYRSADGSNNNPTLPWLGAANTAYSRSIQPLTIQPSGLPDAGLVFDSLFARQKFNPHPNKVSSLFFDWASLVIHGGFNFLSKAHSRNSELTSRQIFSKLITVTPISTRPRPIWIFPFCMVTSRRSRTWSEPTRMVN